MPEAQPAPQLPRKSGERLIATVWRWALLSALFTAVVIAFVEFFRTPMIGVAARRWLEAIVSLSLALILFFRLRGEEARLSRELRIARSGSATLRRLLLRRREAGKLERWLSAGVGTAAVLIADGDRAGALGILGRVSPLFFGGELARLRAVVEADAERAAGGSAMLDGAIQALRGAGPLAHPEAERYRAHVLATAVLEFGDFITARDLFDDFASSADEEVRLYAVWFKTWFGLDYAPDFPEPDLRLALLLARTRGAEALVTKLESTLATSTN